MKTNWIEHMKNLLVKKPEVKDFFSKDKFPLNLVDGSYPIFISLKDRGIYAAHSIFICSDDELHVIKEHLSNIFNVNKDAIGNEGVIYDSGIVHHPLFRDAIEIQKTYSLIYTFTKSFKGNLIDLVTNSSFFVETIKSAGIKEPVPWDVFPELEPDTFGSLQGELEFWWESIWSPFWHSLSPDERNDFLVKNNATPKWREFIEFHC
ncbi:TPA: hypothetical protein ACIJRG_004646 [Escherichia coli]